MFFFHCEEASNSWCKFNLIIKDTMKNSDIEHRVHEINLANTNCPTNLKCDDGKCVQKSDLCNLRADCFDGLDEKYCKVIYESGKPQIVFDPESKPSENLHPYHKPPKPLIHKSIYGSVHKLPQSYPECPAGNFVCKNVNQCIPGNVLPIFFIIVIFA